MNDDWMGRAACAGIDPDVFFPPDDRHGWSPGPARAICAGCPVRVECLTAAVDRREPSGIWGGAGTGLLRGLRRTRTDPTHRFRDGCACGWCTAVTAHFVWLTAKVAADPAVPRRDLNGPAVTHGRRSAYGRGCRCARCLLASRPARDILRSCGTDVNPWWDATFGAGHGYSRGVRAAADAQAAQAALAAQVAAVMRTARHATGWRLDEIQVRLVTLGHHVRADRLAMLEEGGGDGVLSLREFRGLTVVLGVVPSEVFAVGEVAA